ncbi:carboxypeptidase regulatory-like domain-containing protein [Pseudoxanthomonas sp. UTMC 1351]|uniref:carboxypeptidase regulatory-like domain-containing protein n=1 Tax=Pseudoxanthomonas sp. UTMC 1351 TaxID=2695853 RepID=UPI0034CD1A80
MTAEIVNLSWMLGALLALAVLLACTRLIRWQRRAPVTSRSRSWRLMLLLIAQPASALLLYFTLLPPTLPTQAGTMIVATAGAASPPAHAGDRVIALPEAPALAGAERVPDLATALRRYPGTRRLHVVGAGLEARDREATHGYSLRFDPPPMPRGMVRLDIPEAVAIGSTFRVGGKVEGVTRGLVELLDPAGRRIDSAALTDGGEFAVNGTARAAGPATFLLRVRDAQRAVVDTVEVPLWTRDETPPRLLLLAGAPNPEWKYLRRWATDAGLSLHTQIGVGGGLQLGDAPLALNTADFGRFDLVVLDERAWASLSERQRAALGEAVRAGLGMLLRVGGSMPEATRRQLGNLGLAVSGGGDAAPVTLASTASDEEAPSNDIDTPDRSSEADAAAPTLNRRTLRVASTDAVPLLRDAAGTALAYWRAEGRGRVAVWPLTDSFRLSLSGRDDLYGALWSDAFGTLVRAHPGLTPRIDRDAREQQRVSICGIAEGAEVTVPGGAATVLLSDPASGIPPCAGYWPRQSGWHLLRQGERTWPFYVRNPTAAPGLHRAALREATLNLAGEKTLDQATRSSAASPERRGSPWPWFFAWLSISAVLWWFERSRWGRHVGHE